MERTAEYPNGRCAGCGYSGGALISDHAYDDYDYLCGSCKQAFDKECPYVVEKRERNTGDVWSSYRFRNEKNAAACLARLESNPDANEKA